ncbi:tripartite motif-containing protein 16-like [Lates calcarifer]|uniref:Tripartite motif-containing protein 16-like n=1 Tax=Lates calcarifer TaxID=8187 RepID=A0AAJ7V9B8_LATCA|nr:tripartite motif-containing protein 16-like [Lates calcarifer]
MKLFGEMAQRGVQLDQDKLCCSICLDLLKDPVSIPCGHSYCMNCIKSHWDEEDQRVHSCPQCRQTFRPRPVLVKNTMLADLVEELKKTGLQAAPADHCYAGPGDVACDFCTGRKLKALKSCLQCLVSYCEQHLQPHYESPAFKKHKLVKPSRRVQENVCSCHDEVMKIFCRTDQQCICYLCSMDEHRGHNTVSAAAEMTQKQRELEASREKIKQRIQKKEKDVKELQQEVKAMNRSADKAVEDSEKIFTELIQLIEKGSSDVKQQIRSHQKSEEKRVKELQEKLQQEITELRRKDTELEKLSHTEDHIQFLQNYISLSNLTDSSESPSLNKQPLMMPTFEDMMAAASEVRYELQDSYVHMKAQSPLLQTTDLFSFNIRPVGRFEDVTVAVSQVKVKVQVIINELLTGMNVLLPQPVSKAEFFQYSQHLTLQTGNRGLLLSKGNRKVEVKQSPVHRQNIFRQYASTGSGLFCSFQAWSRESLTGRSYWEVVWRGSTVSVAVTYKQGAGYGGEFGSNNESWALYCSNNHYEFRHNNISTSISDPQSSRVGVHLDHRAGILSFYSVSETLTLLHRVQTTFTQPLYAGLGVDHGSSAELV